MKKIQTDFEIRLPHHILKDEMSLLGRLVEKSKYTSAMASNLRLYTASLTEIQISATNLDTTLHLTTEGLASAFGREILIPIDKLRSIVQTVGGNAEIHIRVSGTTVQVLCGKTKFSLTAPDPKDALGVFHRPDVTTPILRMPATDLEAYLGKTLFAINESASPGMATNCLELTIGATIRLVATDGIRAVKNEITSTTGQVANETKQVLIHQRSVKHLLELAKHAPNSTIEFFETDKQLVFSDGQRTLVEPKVAGKFPVIDSFFPTNHPLKAAFNRLELMEAIKRVGCVTDPGEGMSLMLDPKQAVLGVSHSEAQSAEVLEVGFTGDPMTVKFNGRLLLECLSRIGQEQATLELSDQSTIMQICEAAPTFDFRYIQSLFKPEVPAAAAA